MDRDDIIRMAREAGFRDTTTPVVALGVSWEQVQRFAALVAAVARAEENEACAKACEAQENQVVRKHPARIEFDPDSMMARKCAAVIRARGEK